MNTILIFSYNTLMHVAIIDDETVLPKVIQSQLIKNDFSVTTISSYHEFIEHNFSQKVDIYLIDVTLGDGSGFDIVEQLRKKSETSHIPIIIISGHSDVKTKVEGLDIGADDYLVKPFQPEELMARMRSCLRKNSTEITSVNIQFNDIDFNTAERKIQKKGETIHLSRKEKQILELFLLSPGTLISKQHLTAKFWGNNTPSTVINNTINVTICNLRKKLGDSFPLETIVGEGYCLKATDC